MLLLCLLQWREYAPLESQLRPFGLSSSVNIATRCCGLQRSLQCLQKHTIDAQPSPERSRGSLTHPPSSNQSMRPCRAAVFGRDCFGMSWCSIGPGCPQEVPILLLVVHKAWIILLPESIDGAHKILNSATPSTSCRLPLLGTRNPRLPCKVWDLYC